LQEAEEALAEAETEEAFSDAVDDMVEAEEEVIEAAAILDVELMRAAAYEGTAAALRDAGLGAAAEETTEAETVEEAEAVEESVEEVEEAVEEAPEDDGDAIAPEPTHAWYRKLGSR